MRSVIIIPARYNSSRYPGKPLVPLLGKPMIIWVAEICEKAVGKQNVYIATDDKRIEDSAREYGFQSLMTGDAMTGTDRLAEASEQVQADLYINVQGDEPLIEPKDIVKVMKEKKLHPELIINAYCKISIKEKPESVNLPKVIFNEKNELVYMSRLPIPGRKDLSMGSPIFYKQVCIYAFTIDELRAYKQFGRKSILEQFEDIEILRFLELDKKIKMVELDSGSLAVDVPEDVEKVEIALKARFS